jgi:hypothetical protein
MKNVDVLHSPKFLQNLGEIIFGNARFENQLLFRAQAVLTISMWCQQNSLSSPFFVTGPACVAIRNYSFLGRRLPCRNRQLPCRSRRKSAGGRGGCAAAQTG